MQYGIAFTPLVPTIVLWIALAAIQGNPTQATSVLHVSVSIVDADRRPVPVARHALLVSDNPATSLSRGPPSSTAVPSASTTVSASTFSRMVP